MDVREVIRDYLSNVQILQLGTSKNNQPWVTTVYFSYDMNLNLYFLSDPQRRHSQEIEKNSKVGGSFVMPHVYGEKVRGLRFEGEARLLEGTDGENGIMVYRSRFWIVENRVKSHDQNGTIHCYQVVPKTYYLYDEVSFPDSPSQVLQM